MTKEQLSALRASLLEEYERCKADGLKLDMARGKPGADQLDISHGILTAVSTNESCITGDGTDCRNYGGVDGLPSAKKLFAEVYGLDQENVIIGGNSSLNMMYDTIARAFSFGFVDSERPWSREDKIRFLCPVPGYDRHFSICELFGIEMINVPMLNDGPDMDIVRKYVENDATVRGIWCVPKYSNPTGIVYSDRVVCEFAALNPAAPDFKIFWDNAYAVHDFGEFISIPDILTECKKCGRPNMAIVFASTSKVTYPGCGVALMASGAENVAQFKKLISIQTIGPDKINQLRHVVYFKDSTRVLEHMKKHAAIMRPKFELVINAFKSELGGLGIAEWTEPKGGYFISFNAMNGCAGRIYELALGLGLTLTKAGATFPYGKDPDDKNIRIAPSYPSLSDLRKAVERFILCVKLASVEKIISAK